MLASEPALVTRLLRGHGLERQSSVWRRKMKRNTLLAFCLLAALATANEPLWTEAERADKRDIVVEGHVLAVRKLHKVDKREDLHVATVRISSRHKGADKLQDTIEVHFAFSSTGKNIRCPKYVEVSKGTKAKFFIIDCNADWKKGIGMEGEVGRVLVLAMGSDVIKAPPSKANEGGRK
jgi:hypothetical protein